METVRAKEDTVEAVRGKLAALADNVWWSWNPSTLRLFKRVNPIAFRRSDQNPIIALREADPDVLSDPAFQQQVHAAYSAFRRYMNGEGAFGGEGRTAYFCMEYGLHESLPLYAGGLGILAGDHVKAASDLGLPFTAIGLFLRDSYFKQQFNDEGWQEELYPSLDAADLPLSLVKKADGEPMTVFVHIGEQPLHLRAWLLKVGRSNLYLLDSDFDHNPPELRPITRKLYQGGDTVRLQQEIVLGIGGTRLLQALGIEASVYHMNEGHCALLTLELIRERMHAGQSLEEAEEWVRAHTVFTTHTPVPAGHDRFTPHLFVEMLGHFKRDLGLSDRDFLAYGRVRPDDDLEWFTMTVLGLKMSHRTNGVSALHGEVSRRMWTELYPDREVNDVPIGHITNGIHLPTWTAPRARVFLRKNLGEWITDRSNPEVWKRIHDVSDEELWKFRTELRGRLIRFVHHRLPHQSLPQISRLDPEALTIGFARRFAPYKRASLIFHDEQQTIELFSQVDRPIQIVFAGKAHPMHSDGKALLQQIYRMTRHPALRGKIIILEDYNMQIGRYLVSGCDIWLNNPRRPMEASGTSGQKATVHGGLNVSILDGWWPEGYNGENGWSIGFEASADIKDETQQDIEDAWYLYETLRDQVIPTFYDRDHRGIPTAWVQRMRNAIATLTHAFSAERMVRDYIEEMYRG